MFRKEKRGYMTIEATMIMPLIIVGIVFIIYVGFYLYDVSVIRQISYVAALRASRQTDFTSAQMEQYAKNQLKELIDKRLLAVETWRDEIKVNSRTVRISVSAAVQMPFSGFISEKLDLWRIESEAEVTRINPVKYIRTLRGGNGS